MIWSPDSHCLAVLRAGEQGLLQLWGVTADSSALSVVHVFDGFPTYSVQWHPQVGQGGDMLLARCVCVCVCVCVPVHIELKPQKSLIIQQKYTEMPREVPCMYVYVCTYVCICIICMYSMNYCTYALSSVSCAVLYKFLFTQFSGGRDGVVHLWLVKGTESTDEVTPPLGSGSSDQQVSHVSSLEGHAAPITKLAFSETAALLASGCKAGSVRIWDIAVS